MLDQFNHPFILLFLSMAAGTLNSCSGKIYSKHFTSNAADSAYYTFGTSLVTSLVLLLFIGLEGFQGVSPFTLILAVAFGLCTGLRSLIYIKALTLGPLSFTTIILSSCSIIPAFYGLLLGQSITLWQIIGIVLMIVSLFFIVEKDSEQRKATLSWLLFVGIAFFLGGLIGICQTTHQTSEFRFQINEFLLITFLMSLIVSVIDLIHLKKHQNLSLTHNPFKDGKFIGTLIMGGLSCAFINIVNLYLSGVFPSAFFFPVINGGTLLVTVLFSLTVFREKMSPRRWVGMGFGFLSLFFLMGIAQTVFETLF